MLEGEEKVMRFKIASAAVLAFAMLVSGSALAEGKKNNFPMTAAAFKQQVDTRIAKAKTRMEERASKMSADDAKQLRAKFDAGVVKVNAEVAKATADGTVTKDEAKDVRKAAKEIRGGHGHRKHAKKEKKA
jgi:hypothetical protein